MDDPVFDNALDAGVAPDGVQLPWRDERRESVHGFPHPARAEAVAAPQVACDRGGVNPLLQQDNVDLVAPRGHPEVPVGRQRLGVARTGHT